MASALLLPCLTANAEDEKPAPPRFWLGPPQAPAADTEKVEAANARWKERFQLAFNNESVSLDNPWRVRELLGSHESEALTEALADPDRLWAFITASDTAWKDRHAAALKGGQVLSVDWLPKLMAARRTLKREQRIHGWGMAQNPLWCAPMWRSMNRAGMEWYKLDPVRDVLGQKWEVPKDLYEYPLTETELAAAPWPWHVEHALDTLLFSMAPRHRADLNETWEAFGERCRRWYDACMALPLNDEGEIASFVEASQLPVHFMPMEVLARWYKLALDPSSDQWHSIAIAIQRRIIGARNSPNNAATARVFYEDILRYNPKAAHNPQINLWIEHLKNHKNANARAGYYNDNAVIKIHTELRERAFGRAR